MTQTKALILSLAILMCSSLAANAQDEIPASSSLESVRDSIDRLEKAIQRSKEFTRAENSVSNAASNSVVSDLSRMLDAMPAKGKQNNSLTNRTLDADSESDGVSDIMYKLELLRKISSKAKPKLEEITPADANPLREEATTSNLQPPMLDSMKSDMDSKTDMKSPDDRMPLPSDEPLPSRPIETPFSNAQSVIPGPVNAFEMGNSLFQTGKIATALDAFETVDIENLTVFDAVWLRYMKATCHRQLGNRDEASRLYRRISEERNEKILVRSAQWWLKQSDRTSKFEQAMQQLENNLELMTERSDRINDQ